MSEDADRPWPELPYEAWKDTCATLHMYMQIVGKLRLACAPWTNHSWHVPLYLTARGLSTSPVCIDTRVFQVDFDFIDHQLIVSTSSGSTARIALRPRSVADFYAELMSQLRALGIDVKLSERPCEVPQPIPFSQDTVHASYDAEYARRFWQALLQADRVFKQFRARFIGKCSPVHFFWGSFDLALTRFSGRRAPPHPGGVPNLADWVTREAYSHEVSSCGFWPGGEGMPEAIFYSYAYPEPAGFGAQPIRVAGAAYHPSLREFVLPYKVVQQSATPDALLLEFLQDTYEAAARLAQWDRAALECQLPPVPVKD